MEPVKFTPTERIMEIPLKVIWYFFALLAWAAYNPIKATLAIVATIWLTG